MQEVLSELEEKARQIGVNFQVFDASRPEDFEGAFDAMVHWREEMLLLFTSPMFYVNYRHIVDLAARQRLPTMYYFREAVEGGGLMGYGADITDLFAPNIGFRGSRRRRTNPPKPMSASRPNRCQ